MQPTELMNECTCPLFTEYCPIHATNPNFFAPFPPQEDIQARFFFTDNNFPELRTLGPHFGHNAVHLPMASDTSMVQSLPFEDTPTAPLPSTDSFTSISHFPTGVWADDPGHPSRLATSSTTTPMLPSVDQFSNPFTIVNGIEPYGVPVGIASPTHQPTISNTPKERWYTEYGVDRDANGLFQCPFPGCNKMNKRRDQLWEHWKARHNDDPYRCGLCNKSWIYNGEKAHTCNAEMATCQVCQKTVTKHHLTDHQKTRGCNIKRNNNSISATVIDYGGSL